MENNKLRKVLQAQRSILIGVALTFIFQVVRSDEFDPTFWLGFLTG